MRISSERRLRILMVIGQFDPFTGGAERQCMKLSKALKKRGHEVKVVTVWQLRDLPRNERIQDIPVERVWYPMLRFWGIKLVGFGFLAWLTLSWVVYRNLKRFDVVHVHQGLWPGFSATLAANWAAKPIICKIGNSGERFDLLTFKKKHWYGSFGVWLMKKWVDRFVWTSRAVFDDLAIMNIEPQKLVYIPNGVEPSQRTRDKADRDKDKIVFVYSGSLTPKKNLSLLIEAIGNLPDLYRAKLELKILGDGPQKELLWKLIKKYGLERVVNMEGKIQDVEAHLHNSDVFVLPSITEGLSNAALEAMSCGLPPILSLAGGNADLIEIEEQIVSAKLRNGSIVLGVNGIFIKSDCRQSLIEAIKYMVDHPSERVEMGHQSQKIIEAKYLLENVVTRYEILYSQCGSFLAA